jgi:ATP-dependent helicase/nuclease subunit A
MSKRLPNAEQLVAINHHGGKILSAGAGSGKTFVLIEHIIHLLVEFKKTTPKKDWQHTIPFKLSKIVLMTFTKKAAGEMSIRMLKKVDELCEEDNADTDSREYWEMVRNYLSMLNVTTIHSFCHKLISQGYFPELGTNFEILSKIEQKNKISTLFNIWFTQKKAVLSQVFQANSSALITAMGEIFASPELRLMWKETISKTNAEVELDPYLKKIISSNEFEFLFTGQYQINNGMPEKDMVKDWYKLYQSFYELTQKLGPFSAKNFKSYSQWCDQAGKMHMTPKSLAAEDKNYFDKSKEFIKEVRKYSDDFNNFLDHYDVYWEWFATVKDIYQFIDKHFLTQKGLSFSDLEYYVCLGLRNAEVREAIAKNYDYFIVDEFQDTSSVQFEILTQLIGDNHKKIFCVGDRKQAIYGFRGGELQVFSTCVDVLGEKNNIFLLNNFRSLPGIINFNNAFFETIFPLGVDFEGDDPHGIGMDRQIYPPAKNEQGKVVKINAEVVCIDEESLGDDKLSADFYEARALGKTIEELLIKPEIETICILYTRLKPSSYLLDVLSEAKISFSAQVKVAYDDDPIINLFLLTTEFVLNRDSKEKLASTHYMLSLLLDAIEVSVDTNVVESNFLDDLSIVGLRLAFHKLVFSLGISNSHYQENSKLIDSICRVCAEDPVRVYYLLSSEGSDNYSLDLISGAAKKRIIIMSAHASKGLEFDAVMVGGIHTNGQQMPNRDLVGKLPGSFRWKRVYNQKTFFKSPANYEEIELGKLKDFSESKRLLYVACTRAVKFLGWVELKASVGGKTVTLDKNEKSWIKAFRIFEEEGVGLFEERNLEIPYADFKKNNVTLLLKDSLGLMPTKEAGRVGLFAETSVTRLAQLADCPFKFYLSTICKISPPDQIGRGFEESLVDDEEEVFYSSMKRGTRIHADLSALMLKSVNIGEIDQKDRGSIEWALNESRELQVNRNIISEKLIKFSFFGQMVTGTPDLIFENADSVIVWDFKTGLRDDKNEASYWFQLMSYGYAYANLKHFTPEKMISLSLVYIDQKKIITQEKSLKEITHLLFGNWSKTESLNQVNLNHCSSCEYSPICRHYKSSAHLLRATHPVLK